MLSLPRNQQSLAALWTRAGSDQNQRRAIFVRWECSGSNRTLQNLVELLLVGSGSPCKVAGLVLWTRGLVLHDWTKRRNR